MHFRNYTAHLGLRHGQDQLAESAGAQVLPGRAPADDRGGRERDRVRRGRDARRLHSEGRRHRGGHQVSARDQGRLLRARRHERRVRQDRRCVQARRG